MDPLLTIEELIRELDQPNLTGWKQFAQSAALTVYRRPEDVIHQAIAFAIFLLINTFHFDSFRKLCDTNHSCICLI